MTFKPAAWPRKLRSQTWFGGTSKDNIYHRGWMKNQGFPPDLFDGRPVIGILNTWSELTPCNAHLNDLAQRVKHGIYEAGGFPVEVPVFSTSESAFRPTAMMFRNLASMAVEEQMRGQPMDGCVLLVGCDKTTPSLLMAAASTDLPSIIVTGGPMLNGYYKNERVGSGTHLWKFSEAVKAGTMTKEEFVEAEASMSRSPGSCNTMGTASTMASMAEALGMALSGNAAIPAVDSRRRVMAQLTGRRIVQMVKDDLKPSDILKKEAFENAISVIMAVGGSTNSVLHLLAVARTAGVDLSIDDFEMIRQRVPVICDLKPSGRYVTVDLHQAGGIPQVMKLLLDAGLLHGDCLTVTGETIAESLKDVQPYPSYPDQQDVIRPWDKPIKADTHLRVLHGNLAPGGAVGKITGKEGLYFKGTAKVYEGEEDALQGVLRGDVVKGNVVVIRNEGPVGGPGMREMLSPTSAIAGRGLIKDVALITDGRFSGGSHGFDVGHITPEAAKGGPLAIVKNGDLIEIDAVKNTISLLIPDADYAARMAAYTPLPPKETRGVLAKYAKLVSSASEGAVTDKNL